MRITVDVELHESEVPHAENVVQALRSVSDDVRVRPVTDKAALARAITECLRDGKNEAMVANLAHRLADASLRDDCVAVLCDLLFAVDRVGLIEPTQALVEVLVQLPDTLRAKVLAEILQRTVAFLTVPRRADACRAPLVPYAEALAAFVKAKLVNMRNMVFSVVHMVRDDATRAAGLTCLGKLVEMVGDRMAESCDPQLLEYMREGVARAQNDVLFAYDVEYILETMGWSQPSRLINFGVRRSGAYHAQPILALAYFTGARETVVTSSADGAIATWDGVGNVTATVLLARHYAAALDIANQGRALIVGAVGQSPATAPAIVFYREESRHDKSQWVELSAVEPRAARVVTTVKSVGTGGSLAFCCGVAGAANAMLHYDNGKLVHEFSDHTDLITAMYATHDRDGVVITGSRDCSLMVFDLRSATRGGMILGQHGSTVTTVVSSGDYVFTGGLDRKVVAHDLRMMTSIGVARELESAVLSISISPQMVCAAATLTGVHLISFGSNSTLTCRADCGVLSPRYHAISWNGTGNVLYAGGDSNNLDLLARSPAETDLTVTMDDGSRIPVETEKFLRAARARDVVTCAGMLKANPGLNCVMEAGGFSALHFAAFNGDRDMIELLLSYKAPLEQRNYDGNTPLILAAKGHQNEAIKLLVDSGANVNFETSTGGTAAHFAASMGYVDTVHTLVDLGSQKLHSGETGSLVHWAAHSGDVNCVGAMLYELNVPVDIVDKHGGTALFTALFMKKTEVVQFLLEHGANPCMVIPGDCSTPLHIAVEHGGLEDVKLLVAFGGDATAIDGEGRTPLTLAQTKGNDRMVKELSKPQQTREQRVTDAAHYKEQGNKVFTGGENVKAARFYTMAIRLDNSNHIFFSNRAACYFNQGVYKDALWDACRCIALAPAWPKGYLRKAVTLLAMKRYHEALKAADGGLVLDSMGKDLLTVRDEIMRQLRQ